MDEKSVNQVAADMAELQKRRESVDWDEFKRSLILDHARLTQKPAPAPQPIYDLKDVDFSKDEFLEGVGTKVVQSKGLNQPTGCSSAKTPSIFKAEGKYFVKLGTYNECLFLGLKDGVGYFSTNDSKVIRWDISLNGTMEVGSMDAFGILAESHYSERCKRRVQKSIFDQLETRVMPHELQKLIENIFYFNKSKLLDLTHWPANHGINDVAIKVYDGTHYVFNRKSLEAEMTSKEFVDFVVDNLDVSDQS